MQRIPNHIGIIPDGNRRWAIKNGLNKEDGYKHGLAAGLRLLNEAKRRGIPELTYYGFTVDNCKRPKAQVTAFAEACVKAVQMIESADVSLRIVGNTASDCFPRQLLPYVKHRHTENNNRMRVNFLVNYGWEWDMKNGWASQDVSRIDLVVRWGGMRRLSGLLPLQTVYADFYIVDDLWPDFQEEHFDAALDWYSRQDVTLGG